MTEYSANGLTMRWDASDLVAAAQQTLLARVIVAVRPAHPSNVIKAIYTVNGGAPRIARGYRLRAAARSGEEELFAVDLPSQPDGAALTFLPILSCSGREADPRRGGLPFTPLTQPPASAGIIGGASPADTSHRRILRASPSSQSSCSGSPHRSSPTLTPSARPRKAFG